MTVDQGRICGCSISAVTSTCSWIQRSASAFQWGSVQGGGMSSDYGCAMQDLLARLSRRRRLLIALQLGFVAVVIGFLSWAFRDTWADAVPRLRDASVTDLVLACAFLSLYYLL